MRRILLLTCALCIVLSHTSTTAMGAKKKVPPRVDKVTYAEVVDDHPALKEMVDEDGFNSLSGKEQWELIGMLDRYAWFRGEAEYYAGEASSTAIIYLRKAKALKKEIDKKYGHVLKE